MFLFIFTILPETSGFPFSSLILQLKSLIREIFIYVSIYHGIDRFKEELLMNEKLKEMREQVKDEIDHIRRGDYVQNELRMIYWSLRMNSLGKKAKAKETKESILEIAVEEVMKDHPDFKPQYDSDFFKLESVDE
jgi:hypothetical protein